MQIRYWALIIGIVYLLVGIVGFIPALYTAPPAGAPHLQATGAYGYLLGLFPVNVLHDLTHIVIGLLGIITFPRVGSARGFSRFLFLFYGVLAFIGFVPALFTVGGLIPLFGNDVWLHAATAVVSAYFGWIAEEPTYVEPYVAVAHH